jgi:hypothetical protein
MAKYFSHALEMFCCCFRKKKGKSTMKLFRICTIPDIENAFADYTFTHHAEPTYGTFPEQESEENIKR